MTFAQKTYAQKDICPERHLPRRHLPRRTFAQKDICSGARVSSISSRGEGLDPNLLYSPLEEKGPPLFPQFSQKLLNK
jgi:hypothetical protein